MKRYGWLPDRPDHRDRRLRLAPRADGLPTSADVRKWCPPVWNQGDIGSCTAHAVGAAMQFDEIKRGDPTTFTPSRLYIYYYSRLSEGTQDSDSGAMIRDVVKTVNTEGVCHEIFWPYDTTKFAVEPDQNARIKASDKALAYQRLDNTDLYQLRACLAGGLPFVFGFTVYESFESEDVAKTGIVNLPSSSESSMGGHAVLAVGYDDASKRFMVRNSWGDQWGIRGYFTIPYAYLTTPDLADDFWVIQSVSQTTVTP